MSKPDANGHSGCVLVLDDDVVQLKIAGAILDSLGYIDHICTDNPEVALSAINSLDIKFIFLDLNMPRTNGLDMIKTISTMNYNGSLALISAHDYRILESARDFATKNGLYVCSILRKPLSAEAVSRALLSGVLDRETPRVAAPSSPNSVSLCDLEDELSGITDCLDLVYQPKYNMKTEEVCGYEALARWKKDDHLLPPPCFLPLAYESGLIHELSMRIYELALESNRRFRDDGLTPSVAINFPMQTLSIPGFTDRMISAAERLAIPPSSIVIEVTEDQIYGSSKHYLDKLMHLIFFGMRMSIDDFGTGHSSLLQLKTIPFTELKVDRSFVQNASDDSRSAAIFQSSVRLGKSLGMVVVAEGGETRADWDFAKSLGCDNFQGFYKSKPISIESLHNLLSVQDMP
jgi:EAL domain-containing protein (putative c-di-GMP-specific phosphodiesterase class I)